VKRVFAPFSAGLGSLSPLIARIERELSLWLWRRARARQGRPVMLARRRSSGRGYEIGRRPAGPT
jgi:hypothetical protein